jgi:hypothetical protein
MKCKMCGGHLSFYLKDTKGNLYYYCSGCVTSVKRTEKVEKGEVESWCSFCETIHDSAGKVFDGRIAYQPSTDPTKLKTVLVREGKIG